MEMKITLNGIEQVITKQQLYDLAAKGMIGPDTLVYVDGKPFLAKQAKGIVFGQSDSEFALPSQQEILRKHRQQHQEQQEKLEQHQRQEWEREELHRQNQKKQFIMEQQRRDEENQKCLAQYNLKNVASALRLSGIGVVVALLGFLLSAIGNVMNGEISLDEPLTAIGRFVGFFIVTLITIPVLFSFGLLKSLRYSYHNLPTPVYVILYIMCLFVPLLNLLVVVAYAIVVGRAASQATRLLESAGYEIGFFGPNMRQFDTYTQDAKFEEVKPVTLGRLLFFTLTIGGTLAVLIIVSLFGLWAMRTNRADQNRESLSETSAPATISISNIDLVHKKAEQGDPIAQNDLGVRYFDGNGVTQNYEEAVKWFRKSAEQGYIKGQAHLGLCYEKGDGIALDKKEAAKWLRMAAEQDYSTAQCNLGVCYFEGNGVTKNYEEAVKWFRKSAEQNCEQAQFLLASCYGNGVGVDHDFTEAMKWYRKVAESDSSNSNVSHAQCELGAAYYAGLGVPKDKTEAKKWLEKAAKQGDEDAIELLRECFGE